MWDAGLSLVVRAGKSWVKERIRKHASSQQLAEFHFSRKASSA
jgi:hypothetical protein